MIRLLLRATRAHSCWRTSGTCLRNAPLKDNEVGCEFYLPINTSLSLAEGHPRDINLQAFAAIPRSRLQMATGREKQMSVGGSCLQETEALPTPSGWIRMWCRRGSNCGYFSFTEILWPRVTRFDSSLNKKEPCNLEPVTEPPQTSVFSSGLEFSQEKYVKLQTFVSKSMWKRQKDYYPFLQCSFELDFLLNGLFYHFGEAEVISKSDFSCETFLCKLTQTWHL